MSTLIGLIGLSSGALLAEQSALNVTANNVANQNTAGYTDEAVQWTPGDTVNLTGGVQAPSAPHTTTVSLRDRVLDQRVQQQTQQQSGTAAEAAALSQLETVFSITGTSAAAGSTQLGTSLNGFFSALTALSGNPSDAATQQSVLSAAQTLASALNAAAAGIAGVQTSLNANLASSVSQVNALTATIAKLNGQIGSNFPNQDAGPLEDQRQAAITKLSGLIGLDQVTTESNGITLTTTGGTVLVAGEQSYALSSALVGSATQVFDDTGANVTAGISGGSIGGQLTAQGIDLPAASTALDNLAYRVGTSINTQNALGLTSSGVAGTAIFGGVAMSAGAAANIAVVASSPAAIATAGAGEGSSGNTNINALAALANAIDGVGQTMSGNLAALLSQIGSNSSTLQGESAAQQASLTQLTTQQSSLESVNLDTEASNLTRFQRSYQAAAQVFTIVNQLMASAINLGTESTVA